MLLSAARVRTYRFCDDADGSRHNEDSANTNVDAALVDAQLMVMQRAARVAPAWFALEAAISSASTGAVDLTTIKPLMILNLSLAASTSRGPIPEVRFDQGPTNLVGVQTLKIRYVARPTFPGSASTAFTWGHANVTSTAIFDGLVCAYAAAELLITTGKPNSNLADFIERNETAIDEMDDGSSWSVQPLDGFPENSALPIMGYVRTAPDTIQLVRV
jgi:hypothetical protein